MSARFKAKKYTFTASAVTLHAAMGSPDNDQYACSVVIRAGLGNAGTVYWQDVAGEKGGFLEAGEAASFDLAAAWFSMDDIYISGTADDELYITVIG